MKKVNQVIDKVDFKFNLENEFLKSYQNPYFKEIVDSLKMSKEELQNYTSTIDECSIDYEHCKNCKNISSCKNKICGYAYLPKVVDQKLIFNYQPCKYQIKILNDEKITNNISLFYAPKEIKSARMKEVFVEDRKRLATLKW